jgi:hypothetical protein
VPRRLIWQIDMGDGTHAVVCMACRLPLYRGPKLAAAAGNGADPGLPRQGPVWRREPGPALDGRAAHRQPTRRPPVSPITLPPHHSGGGC